jgi:hypothetical protein
VDPTSHAQALNYGILTLAEPNYFLAREDLNFRVRHFDIRNNYRGLNLLHPPLMRYFKLLAYSTAITHFMVCGTESLEIERTGPVTITKELDLLSSINYR